MCGICGKLSFTGDTVDRASLERMCATIVHRGRRKAVHLERVPVDERAAVLQAYIRRAIGGRPHIPVAVDAPLEEFAAVADDYPVFRVTTVAAAPASAH